jgi:hypothetical protein
MVVLPKEFVATKYPGYFWNTKEKQLYSLKVTGELRRLAYHKGGYFYGHKVDPGYRVSHKGDRRLYTLDYLNGLKAVPVGEHEVIGVQEC